MRVKRESRALYSTVVVTAFGYAAQVLSLFAIPFFLGTVGTEDYGLMVTVMAFMGYLNFADAGLSWGSMILIAQAAGRDSRGDIAHIVRHSAVLAFCSGFLVLSVVGGLLMCASEGWRLPMFTGHPKVDLMVAIAGVQLFATLQFGIVYNLFQGLQEGYWTGLYAGIARLLGLGGGVLAAWLTREVAWVMAVQAVAVFLGGIAAVVHAWIRHPWAFVPGDWMDWAQYRAQFQIGLKNFMIQIGRTLGATAPTLGISAIVGPAAVPFYTLPLTLLGLFFMPINSWNANMQGAYGEAWTAGDLDWVRSAFRGSLMRALIFGGLGLALFFALGSDFVQLWTHGRIDIEPAMAISVSLVVTVGAFLAAGQYLLTSMNRHGVASAAELVNGVLALILVVVLVKWFGAWAAGVGVMAAALMTSGWVIHRDIIRQLGAGCFPAPVAVGKTIVAMVAGGVVAWVVHGVTKGGGLIYSLLSAAIAGVCVFIAAALLQKLVPVGDALNLVRQLGRRVGAILPTTRWNQSQ